MPRDQQHDDLAAIATKRLDGFVELIRDHSVRPVLFATRIAVVVLFALIVALAIASAATVGVVHLFDYDVFRHRVWATDFLFGAVFCAGGLYLLGRSHRARMSESAQ